MRRRSAMACQESAIKVRRQRRMATMPMTSKSMISSMAMVKTAAKTDVMATAMAVCVKAVAMKHVEMTRVVKAPVAMVSVATGHVAKDGGRGDTSSVVRTAMAKAEMAKVATIRAGKASARMDNIATI